MPIPLCFYCGDKYPYTVDHVPPKISRHLYLHLWSNNILPDTPLVTIKCCTECSTLLNGKDLSTVRQKAEYLANKYVKRYKNNLDDFRYRAIHLLNLLKDLSK